MPASPWPTIDACGVLYTSTWLMTSDGYWSNSTWRLSLVDVCSRPLSSVVEKSGAKPRIEMVCERPETRCEVRPGRRAIDSAIDASGSLPMSSAEIDSTIWSRVFFSTTAFSRPRRKPVTTISPASASPVAASTASPAACAFASFCAAVTSPVTAALAARRSAAPTPSLGLAAVEELPAGSGTLTPADVCAAPSCDCAKAGVASSSVAASAPRLDPIDSERVRFA